MRFGIMSFIVSWVSATIRELEEWMIHLNICLCSYIFTVDIGFIYVKLKWHEINV